MQTTRLRDAVEHAEAGFCVFPIVQGGKKALVKWRKLSTTDLEQIEAWWKSRPSANIGIDTGKSNLFVLDVDVKNGKDGRISLEMLTLDNEELPPTAVSRTPNGGFHYIFHTTAKVASDATGWLGEGLDIRANGGYIVAPGSVSAAGAWEWLLPGPIAEAPDWLIQAATKPSIQHEKPVNIENIDESFALRRAKVYLTDSAPPAIQGEGGDSRTFKVACELKDMGLDKGQALAMMFAHYNPRCMPSWTIDDLAVKVASAYSSGQNPIGAKTPQADFEPVDPESVHILIPGESKKKKDRPITSIQASTVNLVDIAPRDWVIPGRLMSECITLTVAAGGTGKSMYTMLECLAVAIGKNLTGFEPRKSGRVFIYNLEDPIDEMYRRLAATCILNNLPMKESLENVYVQSGLDRKLSLAKPIGNTPRRLRDFSRLEEYVGDMGFLVVCLDPLVRAHSLSENDNMAADFLMDGIQRIARRTQTSISLVHHTAKNRSGEQVAGNIDLSRGASAFVNAARIVSSVTTMDATEAKRLHLDDATRRSFLQVETGKSNLADTIGSIRWFRKRSVNLVNGDNVGALIQTDLSQFELDNENREKMERLELATLLEEYVHAKPKTLNACAEYLSTTSPHLYGSRHRTSISRTIEQTLSGEGIVVGDRRVRYVLRDTGKGKKWVESSSGK